MNDAPRGPTGDTVVISMDYQKNLPLPKTGTGPEFYKRQLWLHNFCVNDCSKNESTMYMYAEHYAAKGPNEVISCLRDYFQSLPQAVQTVHIFCDNCFSQNKNKYIIAYLSAVVDCPGPINEIHVHYPIPGHSRMPCDRDFGRIEKNKQSKDKVSKPSEWVDVIKTTNVKNPFKIRYVHHPVTDTMENDGTPVVEVLDYKAGLDPIIKPVSGISRFRGLLFQRGQTPKSKSVMTGECTCPVTVLKRGVNRVSLHMAVDSAKRAYDDFLPVKSAKARDVHMLLEYVDLSPDVTFYNNVKGDGSDERESADEYE